MGCSRSTPQGVPEEACGGPHLLRFQLLLLSLGSWWDNLGLSLGPLIRQLLIYSHTPPSHNWAVNGTWVPCRPSSAPSIFHCRHLAFDFSLSSFDLDIQSLMLLGGTCPSLGLCLLHLPVIGLVLLLGLLSPSFGIARVAVIGVAPWPLKSSSNSSCQLVLQVLRKKKTLTSCSPSRSS